MLKGLPCPSTFVNGEHGVVPRLHRQVMRSHAGARSSFVELPDSFHHCMLDQPVALTAVLRTIADRDRNAAG